MVWLRGGVKGNRSGGAGGLEIKIPARNGETRAGHPLFSRLQKAGILLTLLLLKFAAHRPD
jgi:hypothetical protein